MIVPRAAVVGCGYWGTNLVRNLHEHGALVAVCDEDPSRADAAAAQFGVPALAFDELLREPDLNGVVIAAPAAQHASLADQTLRAGKHVFVEKPLATSVDDAEALCELAEERGLILMVGHLLRYHPAFVALEQLVAEGTLGAVRFVSSTRLNLGRVRREEDILWSFAPHDISMTLALVGEEPHTVSATGSAYLNPTVADITTTDLSFPGGAKANVFVSWLHPFKEQRLVVIGEDAMAVFDDGEPWELKLALYRHRIDWVDGVANPVKADGEMIQLDEIEPLAIETRHFLDCVRDGTPPRTDGREGLRVLRVLASAAAAMNDVDPDHNAARGVHPTAVVDDGAEIGANTRIWHFCHVMARAVIGANCTLGQNVMVADDVTVGDDCKIQNNVSIYEGVTLEDGVFCGPSCVFTNVTTPRAEVNRRGEFARTLVRRGATIGANATIVCGTTLGEYCFVAAGAVVTKDVAAYALVAGVPARRTGWVSRAGEVLGEDLTCPRTGERYVETGGSLAPAEGA